MRSYKAHYDALVVALLDSRHPVASNWNSAGRQCTFFRESGNESGNSSSPAQCSYVCFLLISLQVLQLQIALPWPDFASCTVSRATTCLQNEGHLTNSSVEVVARAFVCEGCLRVCYWQSCEAPMRPYKALEGLIGPSMS